MDQLGEEGYAALERKHNTIMKREEALEQFKKLYVDTKTKHLL